MQIIVELKNIIVDIITAIGEVSARKQGIDTDVYQMHEK